MTNENGSCNQAKLNELRAKQCIPGHITVKNKALVSVVRKATADALAVPAKEISAKVFDDEADLGLHINTPLRAEDIEQCQLDSERTIYQLGEEARRKIAVMTSQVTGHQIGKVNLDFDGIVESKPRRTVK